MKNASLVKVGNATLALGTLVSLVAGGLLIVTAPVEASTTATPAPAFVSDSAVTVKWSAVHPVEPKPAEEPAATVEETAAPTPTETPEPAATGEPEPGAAPETSPHQSAATRAPGTTSPAKGAAAPPSPVDVTDPDYDNFKNLQVTVSQTQNLVNQGIRITWTGGKPTSPGEYASDYLQFMQCWGDAATGPNPQQCQWGAPNSTIGTLTGANAASRDLVEYEDARQVYSDDIKRKPPRSNPNLRVFSYPFTSVKGGTDFDVSSAFTSATTNEITAARTGRDGTGSVAFETQTSLEAPHLGCGALTVAGDASTARSCWLVIVPRGTHNLDGSLASTSSAAGRVKGSALSASAWKNRMVVKLDFQPVAVSCPIGNSERRIVGSELIADAFTSWQPALCGSGTTYGFSQIGDGEGRRQITTDIEGGSKLAFVTDPFDAAASGDATIAYAPVANTAIVVGYNIDYSLNASAANFAKNGTQVSDLTLNARLVAKLLTQSYAVDVPGLGASDPVLSANPRSITTDPEFLHLNPEFAGFANLASPDGLLVSLGSSDANAHVWQWLKSDPLAASFLAGVADEWGMKLNPHYLSLGLATASTDSFPKADLSTHRVSPAPEPGYGTLDLRPYTNDMHEAAYRALKADANVKISWDETKAPASYVSSGPQLPGQRFMLALTDAASAHRYGLSTARLVNGAGQAIAPTDASITTAIDAMTDSSHPGVKINNPTARTLGAYPLSVPTYAAINVCAAPKSTLKDYAALLRYAIGDGQVVGDAKGRLPVGYVPVGAKPADATAKVITKLGIEASGKATCSTKEVEEPIEEFDPGFDDGGFEEEAPEPVPSSDPEEAEAQFTADQPLTAARLGLLGALALGLPSMIAGPLLSRRGRRLADLDGLDENGRL